LSAPPIFLFCRVAGLKEMGLKISRISHPADNANILSDPWYYDSDYWHCYSDSNRMAWY